MDEISSYITDSCKVICKSTHAVGLQRSYIARHTNYSAEQATAFTKTYQP